MSTLESHRLGNVARVAIALERMTPCALGGVVTVGDLADATSLPRGTLHECLQDLHAVGYCQIHLGLDGTICCATDLGKLPQPEIPARKFKGAASCA